MIVDPTIRSPEGASASRWVGHRDRIVYSVLCVPSCCVISLFGSAKGECCLALGKTRRGLPPAADIPPRASASQQPAADGCRKLTLDLAGALLDVASGLTRLRPTWHVNRWARIFPSSLGRMKASFSWHSLDAKAKV